MSVRGMSFNKTQAWRDAIGFLNRLSFDINPLAGTVTVLKGGLVYGFKQGAAAASGYAVDGEETFILSSPARDAVFYITMDVNGIIRLEPGSFAGLKGIGANVTGIPWYTLPASGSVPARALVGKVFKKHGLITGCAVCDDPFWCEYEGDFL